MLYLNLEGYLYFLNLLNVLSINLVVFLQQWIEILS
jgi:hypothetical protein